MKTTKKIGWQKYEETIKDQLSSPMLKDILQEVRQNASVPYNEEEEEEMEETEAHIIVPLSESIVQEVALSSSFDCWVGHTNFNITPEIKRKIEQVDGIEILKIFSRYRFFIGIGRMFNFKEVRQDIEKHLGAQNI